MNSGSIWRKLVVDAKDRGCFYDVSEGKSMAQAARGDGISKLCSRLSQSSMGDSISEIGSNMAQPAMDDTISKAGSSGLAKASRADCRATLGSNLAQSATGDLCQLDSILKMDSSLFSEAKWQVK